MPPEVDPLPVDAVLPEVRAALARTGVVVLEAPPGAGKTTRVPLDLLAERRLRRPPGASSSRAAWPPAGPLGAWPSSSANGWARRSGWSPATSGSVSRTTRIEVVTDGVLLRRLQRDPSLPGVGALLFDEFHERRLESDLALAFALEIRSALRADLRLIVTSATLDGVAVAALLDDAPVMRAEGRTFPVAVTHDPDPPPERAPRRGRRRHRRGRSPPTTATCSSSCPGVRELRAVARRLPALAGRGRGGGRPAPRGPAAGRTGRRAPARSTRPAPGRARHRRGGDLADRPGRRGGRRRRRVARAPVRRGQRHDRPRHRARVPRQRRPARRPGGTGGPRAGDPAVVRCGAPPPTRATRRPPSGPTT